MNNIKITKTQRNNIKIIYEGYSYVKDRSSANYISWRCSRHECRGRLHTDIEITKELKKVEHYHEKEEYKIIRQELSSKLKFAAINNEEPFDRSIIKHTMNFSKGDNEKIGDFDNLRDYYVKLRRKTKNPGVQHNEDLLEMYKYTYDNKLFLQLDTGRKNEDRILFFYREESLQLLKRTNCMLCDATFKTAPKGFIQLLVIHIMFFKKRIPIAFILMKKKNMSSYNFIFEHIIKKVENFSGYIISDFEAALVQSIRKNFPNSKPSGCYFHFSQIIWRKIQEFGYTILYKENSEFRKFVKYLLLLSYVPINYVLEEFEKIERYYSSNEDYTKVITFFRNSFLTFNESSNKSIPFWSLNERILIEIPTTTNSLEAWHSHLNSQVNRNSGNIGKIIDILKIQEKKTEITISNLLSGNYKNRTNNSSFRKIVQNYEFYVDFEYFDHLKELINFKFS